MCAIRISDKDHLEQEIKHLSTIYNRNGYHKRQVSKVIQKARRGPHRWQNEEQNGTKVALLYIKGTMDIIARILKKRNLKVTFSPPKSIGRMLESAKDVMDPKRHKGVYAITCSCGKICRINGLLSSRQTKRILRWHHTQLVSDICLSQACTQF